MVLLLIHPVFVGSSLNGLFRTFAVCVCIRRTLPFLTACAVQVVVSPFVFFFLIVDMSNAAACFRYAFVNSLGSVGYLDFQSAGWFRQQIIPSRQFVWCQSVFPALPGRFEPAVLGFRSSVCLSDSNLHSLWAGRRRLFAF